MIAMVIAALVVAFVATLAVALVRKPGSGEDQDEQLPTPPSSTPASPRPTGATNVSVASRPLDFSPILGPPSSPLSDWEVIDMYEDENPVHNEVMSPNGRHSKEVRIRKAKGVKAVRRMCMAKYT